MLTADNYNSGELLSDDPQKPNWLLRGLIILSVGVHLLILMHMAHIYRPRVFSRIELTLKQISSPQKREVPRPPSLVKPITNPQEQVDPEAKDPQDVPVKPLQYASPDPIDPDMLSERFQIPRIPVAEDTDMAVWQDDAVSLPAAAPSSGEESGRSEAVYNERVKKQILTEARKIYDRIARRRIVQGVAMIEFTIAKDGHVISSGIVKSSGSRILDKAAVDSLEKASPFAKPPNGPMIIQLPIKFEML